MTKLNIQVLIDKVRGPVLQDGDAGYDAARVIWNGMIDRKPRVIVRCKGVADVIDAVNFARDNQLFPTSFTIKKLLLFLPSVHAQLSKAKNWSNL